MFLKPNKTKESEILDCISIFSFENNVIINEDGSIAVGYEIDLFEEESISKEDFYQLIQTFTSAVNKLPPNTVVQKLDIYFEDRFQINVDPNAAFIHRKTLEQHNNATVLKHKSYLFISFYNKEYTAIDTFLARGKHYLKQINNGSQDKINLVEALCSAFIDSMPIGLTLKRLNNTQNNILVNQYLSLCFNKEIASPQKTYANNSSCLSVGDNLLNIVSMSSQSDNPNYFNKNQLGANGVTSSFIWPLTHFSKFPHIVCQNIRIIDHEQYMKKKYRALEISKAFKLNRRNAVLAEEADKEFIDLESDIISQDEQLIMFNLFVILWDSSKKLLHERINQTLSGFNKLSLTAKVETVSTCNLFLGNIPGCAGQLYKGCPMTASTALSYFNWNTPRKGDTQGELILCDRHGNPLYYNPFKYSLDNQHAFVFGPSGSGKSFFNGKLIKDRYLAGHTVIVIDSGGTYRHLFKILDGKYIEYQPDNPLKLNPFLIKKDENNKYKTDLNKISFLIQFIGKIWKGDLNKNPLTEVEEALLSKFLVSYYSELEAQNIPSLISFCNWLKRQDQNLNQTIFNTEEFFLIIEPFTNGIYKEHFNSEIIEYLEDSKLICFELESVKNNPKLYPLVVQVLFDFVLQIVSNQPDAKKFIDIEEGWTMLNDSSQSYIESFFRKGRKTNTSIRIITQSIEEIKESAIVGAMKNNASTFILLYNDKESVRKEIGDFLGMREFDMEKYESMRRKDGIDSYREVFIKEMNNSFVWQLKPSLTEYAILTSRPDERNRIDKLIKEKGDIELAIMSWVDEYKKLHIC
jgi:conjugal transfer ATP-binding protein TraC